MEKERERESGKWRRAWAQADRQQLELAPAAWLGLLAGLLGDSLAADCWREFGAASVELGEKEVARKEDGKWPS